ncbi:Ca-activated chloride channel family protein [Loktanella atrilutea]|uniref:Ca-activated chloride channel family protein n=1 Tax=Loktanella atrilutea TaxID=366533 RepID=A0A1M4ZKD1_LOKAT|nr:VWA domain-containing protein [Loktanella atrilutea]SHF18451.1 Ca-activated chloride channel family protein [Loktanella atrilutea]
MFDLATPWALLLLPLPLLVLLLPARQATDQAFALPEGVARQATPDSHPMRGTGPWLAAAIWLALVLSIAGPQRITLQPNRTASGRDIILTLDMSGSMATPDFSLNGETVSRLAAVKDVAARFVAARTGDRIGLVIFADRAYVAAPLTHDLTAVSRAIAEAEIGLTGRSTAISDGLGLALKRITAEPSTSKIIVLLSDGRDTAARLDAEQVAALAAENGVRVHTIALGPEDLETRPAARDAVDLATLRAIATASGGTTFRVRTTDDLQQIMAELDRLEPNPGDRPPLAVPHPLWPLSAASALVLCLFAGLRRRA